MNGFSSRFAWAGMALILAACSADEKPEVAYSTPASHVIKDTVKGSFWGAVGAVQLPLEDVGLKRQPIPEKLQMVLQNPYATPYPMNCPKISSELLQLNQLLGPDMGIAAGDTPSVLGIPMPSWQKRGEYVQKGSEAVQQQSSDMVKGQVDIIPYRGWVRKLSGAERHAKKVEKAYEAGRLRRAYLKGLALMLGCGNMFYMP